MDSPATSPSIRFLDLKGTPVDSPKEWKEALIEVQIVPAVWTFLDLTINDSPQEISLRQLNGQTRVIADWPRSNAGTYNVKVRWGDSSICRRTTVTPTKLSAKSFEAMITDLESKLPAAITIGLQRSGGLAGLSLLSPDETTVSAELVRLRRAVQGNLTRPGLAAVLTGLAQDPHQVLRSEELWTPFHRARRPHPARLIHAVRFPANMVDERFPTRVIDTRVHPTFDVYENRLVRLFHDQVFLRFWQLERILSRSAPGQVVMDELIALRSILQRARREATFLDDVQATPHLPTQITMVLLKHPTYRAAFEGYLELNRSIAARLDEPALDLPLENLPMLYQSWGTLVACNAVLDVAVDSGYRLDFQRLVHHTRNEVFIRMIPAGKVALRLVQPENGSTISLTPEKAFTSTSSPRSVSFMQVPDITIQIDRPSGDVELILIDPKYKLDSEIGANPTVDGRPKKTDIDKMHAYRDAIRDNVGRHLVTEACTIYPGPAVHYTDGLQALSGVPGSDTLYRSISRLVSSRIT